MQFDVHSSAVTVEESLIFSARLRFTNDVDDSTVQSFVHEVSIREFDVSLWERCGRG